MIRRLSLWMFCYLYARVGCLLPSVQESLLQALQLSSPMQLEHSSLRRLSSSGQTKVSSPVQSMEAICKQKDSNEKPLAESFGQCNRGIEAYRKACLPEYCIIESLGEDMTALGRLEDNICKVGHLDVEEERLASRKQLNSMCRCLGMSMGAMAHGACCIGHVLYSRRGDLFRGVPENFITKDMAWNLIDSMVFSTVEAFSNWQCQKPRAFKNFCGEMIVDMMAIAATHDKSVLPLKDIYLAPQMCLQFDALGMCRSDQRVGPFVCQDVLEKLVRKYGCCLAGYRDVLRNMTFATLEGNMRFVNEESRMQLRAQLDLYRKNLPTGCGAVLPTACAPEQVFKLPIKHMETCPAGSDDPGLFDGGCQAEPSQGHKSSENHSAGAGDHTETQVHSGFSVEHESVSTPAQGIKETGVSSMGDCLDPSGTGCSSPRARSMFSFPALVILALVVLLLSGGFLLYRRRTSARGFGSVGHMPPTEMKPSTLGYAPPQAVS